MRMFWNVFRFEWTYRLKRPATYAYFLMFFIIMALLTAAGGINASEKVFYNAPTVIALLYGLLSIFSILIGSAVMGVPLVRDLDHDTHEVLFSTPMGKKAYFWGRFWGSFSILVLISSGAVFGLMLGSVLGPVLGWEPAERFGPFHLEHYLQPFVTLYLPSLFFSGCLFFGLVALTRNGKITYTTSIMLFILYLLGNFLVSDLDNRNLVDLLDPFALTTLGNATKYYTPAQQNEWMVPLVGNLLLNRLLWTAIGSVVLLLCYAKFSLEGFSLGRTKKQKRKKDGEAAPAVSILPRIRGVFTSAAGRKALWHLSKLEFRNILRDPYFLAIFLGAVLFLFIDDFIGSTTYGVSDLPITLFMLATKSFNYSVFVFIILMFYAGEAVHRDRSTGFAAIGDALPISESVQLFSKFLALVGVCLLMVSMPMVVGVIAQTLKGYFNYKFDFYFIDLYLITFWDYLQMVALIFVIHVLVNNKFLGHFVAIAVWFLLFVLQAFLEVDYNLFLYSYKPGYTVSEMNGFGHFAQPLFWFNLLWNAAAALMLLLAALAWTRGTETGFKKRFAQAKRRFSGGYALWTAVFLALFVGSWGYIYNQVSLVNHYRTFEEELAISANYEKKYKKYEFHNVPKVVEVKLYADLYPNEREAFMRQEMVIWNKGETPIDTLLLLSGDGASYTLIYNGQKLQPSAYDLLPTPLFSLASTASDTAGFRRFALPAPLMPGDSARMELSAWMRNKGFENNGFSREIVYNGTFTTGNLPTFGYDEGGEIFGDEDREKMGLPDKDDEGLPHRHPWGEKNQLFSKMADLTSFECVVSTVADQVAVAPGYLKKQWTEGNRNYFHYVQDSPINYFFNLSSARYNVFRDQWVGSAGETVNIEIFHHPEHAYNIDRFVAGLKDGLTYNTQAFGPFQFRQIRILEFPRYASFAQSFPNTVPYSEDFGWMADFSDPDDYDYCYYVTAHELGHQWWGHQVVPNLTRGANLISESLAEYSALMAAHHRYGKDNVQKFLKYDLDRYLRGRANESKKENTFINCNRPYQWYQKGSLILYALQDYIGEERLNNAIRTFRDSFAFRSVPTYPGSYDLYDHIQRAVPDSLQYFVEDTWLKLTLYNNRVEEVEVTPQGNGRYAVKMQVVVEKLYADEKGNEVPATQVADYLDIGIFAEDKKDPEGRTITAPLYLKKHKLKAGRQTLEFVVNEKPVKVGIDPYNKMIDRIADDNMKKI